MDHWMDGKEEDFFFFFSFSPSSSPRGSLSMVSFVQLLFTHRRCDHCTWRNSRKRRTQVTLVSGVLSSLTTLNKPQLYSHNTSTTLCGVLSERKNDEQDLTGYKTRRKPQNKTIILHMEWVWHPLAMSAARKRLWLTIITYICLFNIVCILLILHIVNHP